MQAPSILHTSLRTKSIITKTTACRLCGSQRRTDVWSFGETPLANAYRTVEELGQPEFVAPLTVARCEACQLVQLRETVDPTVLFRDYLYVSSTSPTFVAHFDAYAAHLTERFHLRAGTFVIDIGSNDGILLKPLRARGVRALGVEPVAHIADRANAEGAETLPAFFSRSLAREIRSRYGPATVITANNVFAHMPDLDDALQGVQELLAEDGVCAFEVQYLGDLLEKNLFDIVYHEHLCYYHVAPLVPFFARHGFELFDVQRVPVHGGSIRVFVQRANGPHPTETRIQELLDAERAQGLHTLEPYRAFWQRVQTNKESLVRLLSHLRASGKRLAGYGAPAKATTLLQTFGIGPETLEYIVDDDTKFKQGRYMPGSHIPIVAPERLYRDRPDACLILAWNFAEPLMHTHRRFTQQGGRFIVPVPEPRIV
ncbi:MAG: SAM-dependent methyltransferase [Parcubacteria group bacterium Gr01-1014_38]|nr:MAG: SAM-dependent methyltransferase [Parcubacteria group bacterium Gr01-1014_38]